MRSIFSTLRTPHATKDNARDNSSSNAGKCLRNDISSVLIKSLNSLLSYATYRPLQNPERTLNDDEVVYGLEQLLHCHKTTSHTGVTGNCDVNIDVQNAQ